MEIKLQIINILCLGQFKDYNDLARVAVDNYKFYIWKPDKLAIYGYMNVNGEMVVKPKYVYADMNFGEDQIACVGKSFYIQIPLSGNTFYRDNFYYGVIDTSGEKLIPFRYTWKIEFEEGLAATRGAKGYNGGKWEIIKDLR